MQQVDLQTDNMGLLCLVLVLSLGSGEVTEKGMPMQNVPRDSGSQLHVHVVHSAAQPPGVPDYWPNLDL